MVRRNIIVLFVASAVLVVNGARPLKNRDSFGEEAASLMSVASSAIAAFGTSIPLPIGAGANLDTLASATQASSGQGATKTLTGHTAVEPTITPPSTSSSTKATDGGASSSFPSSTSGFVTSVTSSASSSGSSSTSSSTPKPTTSHKNGAEAVHIQSTNMIFSLVAVLGGAVFGAFAVL